MKTMFTVRKALAVAVCVLAAVLGLVGIRGMSRPDNVLPAAPKSRVHLKATIKATGRSLIVVSFPDRGRAHVRVCVDARPTQPSNHRCAQRTTRSGSVTFRPRMHKVVKASPNGRVFVTATVKTGGKGTTVRVRRNVDWGQGAPASVKAPTPVVENISVGRGIDNQPYTGPRLHTYVRGQDGVTYDFRTTTGTVLCSQSFPDCVVSVAAGTYQVQVRAHSGKTVSDWSQPSPAVWIGDECSTAIVTAVHAPGTLLSIPATDTAYIPVATLGPTVHGTPTLPKLTGGNVTDDGFRSGLTDNESVPDSFAWLRRTDEQDSPYDTMLAAAEPFNAPAGSTLYLLVGPSTETGVTDTLELGLAQSYYGDVGSDCAVLWRQQLQIVRTP